MMHSTVSFLVGLGLKRERLDWAIDGKPFPRRSLRFYLAGVALHARFNIVATALALARIGNVE